MQPFPFLKLTHLAMQNVTQFMSFQEYIQVWIASNKKSTPVEWSSPKYLLHIELVSKDTYFFRFRKVSEKPQGPNVFTIKVAGTDVKPIVPAPNQCCFKGTRYFMSSSENNLTLYCDNKLELCQKLFASLTYDSGFKWSGISFDMNTFSSLSRPQLTGESGR